MLFPLSLWLTDACPSLRLVTKQELVDGEADVGYTRTFPLTKGSELRDTLKEDMGSRKKDRKAITFTLHAKTKGHRCDLSLGQRRGNWWRNGEVFRVGNRGHFHREGARSDSVLWWCRTCRAEEVGKACFELTWLLEEKQDALRHSVRLEDGKGEKIGSLLLSVKGYDAIEALVGKEGRR